MPKGHRSEQSGSKVRHIKSKAKHQKKKYIRAEDPVLAVFMWGVQHSVSSLLWAVLVPSYTTILGGFFALNNLFEGSEFSYRGKSRCWRRGTYLFCEGGVPKGHDRGWWLNVDDERTRGSWEGEDRSLLMAVILITCPSAIKMLAVCRLLGVASWWVLFFLVALSADLIDKWSSYNSGAMPASSRRLQGLQQDQSGKPVLQ